MLVTKRINPVTTLRNKEWKNDYYQTGLKGQRQKHTEDTPVQPLFIKSPSPLRATKAESFSQHMTSPAVLAANPADTQSLLHSLSALQL